MHDVEVIDLARSNIDPGGLLELAVQSLELKPDVFVLFAGNNWTSPELYDAPLLRRLGSGLRARGYRGFFDTVDQWRTERTAAVMDSFASSRKEG